MSTTTSNIGLKILEGSDKVIKDIFNENAEIIDAKIADLQAGQIENTSALETRVTATETSITSNTTNIATNTTAITTNTNNITALTTQVAANSNDIEALETRATEDEAKISINASDIDALETRTTTAEGNITTLITQVATNTSDIDALTTRVTTAETNIATNTTDISNLETNVAAHTTAISTNTTNIATNTTNIADVTSDLAALQTATVERAVVFTATDQIIRYPWAGTIKQVQANCSTTKTADIPFYLDVMSKTDYDAGGTTWTRVGGADYAMYLLTSDVYVEYGTTEITSNTAIAAGNLIKITIDGTAVDNFMVQVVIENTVSQ